MKLGVGKRTTTTHCCMTDFMLSIQEKKKPSKGRLPVAFIALTQELWFVIYWELACPKHHTKQRKTGLLPISMVPGLWAKIRPQNNSGKRKQQVRMCTKEDFTFHVSSSWILFFFSYFLLSKAIAFINSLSLRGKTKTWVREDPFNCKYLSSTHTFP